MKLIISDKPWGEPHSNCYDARIEDCMDSERFFLSDFSFVKKNPETNQFALPHSYAGDHGTTLESLPLNLKKVPGGENLYEGTIAFDEIFHQEKDFKYDLYYPTLDSSEKIIMSKVSVQDSEAYYLLMRQLRDDLKFCGGKGYPRDFIDLYAQRSAQQDPKLVTAVPRKICFTRMPKNAEPKEIEFLLGTGKLTKALSAMRDETKELPRSYRILRDIATTVKYRMEDRYYVDLVDEFKEKMNFSSIKCYSAAVICSGNPNAADAVRSLQNDGKSRQSIEKLLKSKDNCFRKNPVMMQEAKDFLKSKIFARRAEALSQR